MAWNASLIWLELQAKPGCPGPQVIKLFSLLDQLMKFQLLIESNMLKTNDIFLLTDVVDGALMGQNFISCWFD